MNDCSLFQFLLLEDMSITVDPVVAICDPRRIAVGAAWLRIVHAQRAYKCRQRQKFFSLKKVFSSWEKPSRARYFGLSWIEAIMVPDKEPTKPAAHIRSRAPGGVVLRREQ